MRFDFANYTFSFFVSILSAILGLGYPLILDRIKDLNDIYKSTRISERFLKEKWFKFYVFFLIISIIIAFIAPFLMLFIDESNDYWIIIIEMFQALFMLLLVCFLLKLFKNISDYINPRMLGKIIQTPSYSPEGGNDSNIHIDENRLNDLFCLVDIANNASKNENFDLFNECISKIIKYGETERNAFLENDNEYNVSILLKQVFRQIIQNSSDESSIYFYNSNIVSSFFYNYLEKDHIIGEESMKLIWQDLYHIVLRSNNENFMSYWTSAYQYCMFKLDHYKRNYRNVAKYMDYCKRFREFHYMVGALLVNSRNAQMIKFLLFFSNITPAKYPLVPSSLSQIIDALEDLENKNLTNPFYYSGYIMPGINNGVFTNYTIKEIVFQYFGLLVIRLTSVNDWNITYSYPLQTPTVDPKTKNNIIKWKIELIDKLLTSIDYWYKEENVYLLRSFGLSVIPENSTGNFTAKDNIQEYKSVLMKTLEDHNANPKIDYNKIEILKLELEKVKKDIEIPMSKNKVNESLYVPIEVCTTVDPNSYSEYEGYGWSNFPDLLIHMLSKEIENYYLGSIFNNCPRILFEIPENQLFDFLYDLNLSDKYDMLSLGVDFGFISYNQKRDGEISYEEDGIYYRNCKVWNFYNQEKIVLIKQKEEALLSFDAEEDNLNHGNIKYERLGDSDLYFHDEKGLTDDKELLLYILKKVYVDNLPLNGLVEIRVTEKSRYPYKRKNKTIEAILGH